MFAKLFIICTLVLTCSVSDAEVTIVVNRGPFETVHDAAFGEDQVNFFDSDHCDERAATECYAALELRTFLAKASTDNEQDIQFASPSTLPPKGDVFILGSKTSNQLISQTGDPLESDQSYRIRSIADHGRTVTTIEGGDREGTLYGVYRYLEQLGGDFIGLGVTGTVLPSQPVDVPQDLQLCESPSFLTRGYWAWGDRDCDLEFFEWMARNKLNYWTASEKERNFCKKLGLKLTIGGHDFQHKFLNPEGEYPYNHPLFHGDESNPNDPYRAPDESIFKGDADHDGKLSYFEAHPEWYGLLKKKRRANLGPVTGTNFCTSNDDAVTELAKNFVQALINGEEYRYADIVNLWMLDNGKWCQCKNCRKVGNLSDRLVQVVDKIRKFMEQEMASGRLARNVEVVSLAYHETLPPPSKALPADFDYDNCYFTYFPIERTYTHALNDPSSTEINAPLSRALQEWIRGKNRNYHGALCVGEYYNVSRLRSLPVLFTQMIAADIPWYYEIGVRHFNYMHVPTRDWGTWTLNQYLLGRLLWDHQSDSPTILDDYFALYYPTTSSHARTFYQHLELATANAKAITHYIGHDRYALRAQILKSAENLFPKKTLPYEPNPTEPNAGISLVAAVSEMTLAGVALDAALLAVTNPVEAKRLQEDQARFIYGEAMYKFYDHMVKLTRFHNNNDKPHARREFGLAHKQAERLRSMTNICQVSSAHANAKNGLEASQIDAAYTAMATPYGPPSQ